MHVENKHRNKLRQPVTSVCCTLLINKHNKLCRQSIPEISCEFQCNTVVQSVLSLAAVLSMFNKKRNKGKKKKKLLMMQSPSFQHNHQGRLHTNLKHSSALWRS